MIVLTTHLLNGHFTKEDMEMTSRHMKRCSTVIIREMQIKTIWATISHLSEWPSSMNQETSAGEDVEKREPFCTVGGNADWCSHCGKLYGVISKKLKMDLPFDLAIPLLGIYPKEPKTLIQKNISTPMFIAELFTITKIWKQPSVHQSYFLIYLFLPTNQQELLQPQLW